MRVVIIDPYNACLTEADMPDSREALLQILSPPNEKPTTLFERVSIGLPDQFLYIDESGRLNERRMGFECLSFYPEPFCGVGVLIGESPIDIEGNGGEWVDCRFDVKAMVETQLITMIEFTDANPSPPPKFTVKEFTSTDDLLKELFGEIHPNRNIH